MAKISLIVFAVLLISQLNLIQFVVMGAPAPEEVATTAASANPAGPVDGILPVTLPTDLLIQSKNLTAIIDLIPSTSSNPLTAIGPITNVTGNVSQQIGGIVGTVSTIGTVKPPVLFNPSVGKSQVGKQFLPGFPPVELPTVQPPTGQQPTTAQPPVPLA
ncbi:hypothetical protein HCN44_002719 [Aphidius gifuensis]|uniref:Venom protein n=1 Tax=Aphidius gifuensis TaxID=684658 RepID=A0A835CPD3_APHGI|nr:uncharacterized protein LOC122854452 [Aphidius gifuensis]KAF7991157.1 hypothetical protein HCN44_002719 [Aphidius gifuensis]